MTERHALAGPARGETLSSGRVGACVRLPLDSPPTPRWSAAMSARLATSLAGHAAVGHVRLNELVQGSEIVIEGVEPAEAELLGPAVRAAIDSANGTCGSDPAGEHPRNMPQAQADETARAVDAGLEAG